MSFWTVALTLYFATWLLIPHLLLLRKRPAATLAWMWSILLFPFIGAIVYLAIGTERLKRKRLRRRAHFRTVRDSARTRTRDIEKTISKEDAAFAHLIARLNEIPISHASAARLLPDATTFYDALRERIDQAEHHVHVQFFIWRADAAGDRLLAALVAAAKRGVQVRVLIDELGSVLLSSGYFRPLIEAGGEFSWFLTLNPRRHRYLFNLRNHRKLQIIDGRIAFVGGMNVGIEYQGLDPDVGAWKDLQIELEGPIACVLQESFADDWFFATEKKIIEGCYYPESKREARWPALVIAGGPDSAYAPVQKSIISLLHHAQKRVWLTTGYFVPNDVVITALQLAAARGVDVRLLVTEKTDHPYLLRISRSYYDELLHFGVRIFEYTRALNHTKAGIIDEDWLMVGSANIDNRSMRLNFELNLLLRMPSEADKLVAILEEDFRTSTEITIESHGKRPQREKWLEAVCRPFAPVM